MNSSYAPTWCVSVIALRASTVASGQLTTIGSGPLARETNAASRWHDSRMMSRDVQLLNRNVRSPRLWSEQSSVQTYGGWKEKHTRTCRRSKRQWMGGREGGEGRGVMLAWPELDPVRMLESWLPGEFCMSFIGYGSDYAAGAKRTMRHLHEHGIK